MITMNPPLPRPGPTRLYKGPRSENHSDMEQKIGEDAKDECLQRFNPLCHSPIGALLSGLTYYAIPLLGHCLVGCNPLAFAIAC